MVKAVRAVRAVMNSSSRRSGFSIKCVNFTSSSYEDVELEQLNPIKELSESNNSLDNSFQKLSVDSLSPLVLHKLFRFS